MKTIAERFSAIRNAFADIEIDGDGSFVIQVPEASIKDQWAHACEIKDTFREFGFVCDPISYDHDTVWGKVTEA